MVNYHLSSRASDHMPTKALNLGNLEEKKLPNVLAFSKMLWERQAQTGPSEKNHSHQNICSLQIIVNLLRQY